MSQSARPKRAGEDYARTQDSGSKKPRFDYRNPSTLAADEPEEDVILDADVIGKSGAQVKRNAVNIDGYESDSDNDNFDSRAAERARQKQGTEKSRQEDENDMFADLDEDMQGTADGDDDEDLNKEGKKNKKAVKFMDQGQIEGQNMESKSGGHVSANFNPDRNEGATDGQSDSESSSGDEEERDQLPTEMEEELAAEIGAGGKKRHAPRLDAFNLKQEEEEGRFDESGNFVRKANDPDAQNDNWLDGLSRKDMKRAKEAQDRRDQVQRRKALEDDAVLTSDLLSSLISNLETGESSLEALQRLNKGKPKETKIPKWKQKKLKEKSGMDVSVDGEESPAIDSAEKARKKTVEAITGAADALYSRGQHDIYDMERELLTRQYRRETGEDWKPPVPTALEDAANPTPTTWEYRWSDRRDGGEPHGPYEAGMMKAWTDAGYFGEGVEFRRIGETEWSRVLDIGKDLG